MAEKGSQGQADKKAAEETTAAAAAGVEASSTDSAVDPYPNYDVMPLEELQKLADSRGVEVNRDVLKAHLITELRAADSGSA